jgi:hypothetical protein
MTMYLSTSVRNELGKSFSNSNDFYIHALRRDSSGMLYYTVVKTTDVEVMDFHRTDGTPYPDFIDGIDYVEETTEEKSYTNHPADKYQQYRFDFRRLSYYIDDDGYLVVRFGSYDYSAGPK